MLGMANPLPCRRLPLTSKFYYDNSMNYSNDRFNKCSTNNASNKWPPPHHLPTNSSFVIMFPEVAVLERISNNNNNSHSSRNQY